jgi:hypothetical protein
MPKMKKTQPRPMTLNVRIDPPVRLALERRPKPMPAHFHRSSKRSLPSMFAKRDL